MVALYLSCVPCRAVARRRWPPARRSVGPLSTRLAGLLVLILAGCAPPPERPAPVATPAATPAPIPPAEPPELVEVTVATGPARRLAAVVVDLDRFRLRVVAARRHPQDWQTAEFVAARLGALAVLNGGYFDERNQPLGLLVTDGEELVPLRRTSWPVFAIAGGRARIVARTEAQGLAGLQQAVQCGPRLVSDRQVTNLKPSEPLPRSAVGVDGDGRVVLAATTEGGASLQELGQALARPRAAGGLGCVDALNLDGGPSTQFVVPGRVRVPGVYAMPSHLVVLPRTAP